MAIKLGDKIGSYTVCKVFVSADVSCAMGYFDHGNDDVEYATWDFDSLTDEEEIFYDRYCMTKEEAEKDFVDRMGFNVRNETLKSIAQRNLHTFLFNVADLTYATAKYFESIIDIDEIIDIHENVYNNWYRAIDYYIDSEGLL